MIRVSFLVASLALVAVTEPVALCGQQGVSVEAGARVRVGVGYVMHVGTLVEKSADSWMLEVAGRDSLLVLPVASFRSLEVRVQKTRALSGALIGFACGAQLGTTGGQSEWDLTPITVPLFGVTGSAIGILIGRSIRFSRWEAAPLDRLRLSMVPRRRGGLAVALSVRM